jgi:hypothetical protein
MIKSVIALTILAAVAQDVTGKWTGSIEVEEDGVKRSEPAFIELKLAGEELVGRVGANEGEAASITNAKIKGDQVTFESSPKREGSTSRMHFDLVLSNDQLTGTVTRTGGAVSTASKVALKIALKRADK